MEICREPYTDTRGDQHICVREVHDREEKHSCKHIEWRPEDPSSTIKMNPFIGQTLDRGTKNYNRNHQKGYKKR